MAGVKARIKEALPDIAVDWVMLIRAHRRVHGEYPRILRPRTFNEKVLRRSLLDRRKIFSVIADKLAVREYVRERLGGEVLTKLYHVTENPRTIPFSELPEKFVVKPTHASGMIQLVQDKSQLDAEALIAKCEGWLARSYYKEMREIPYRGIRPRILVEEFIAGPNGSYAWDYKFFVFRGRVQMIQVVAERFESRRIGHMTRERKRLDVRYTPGRKFEAEIPMPRHLDRLIAAAETLGREFDFIRVDFYAPEERIYFGEMTATPMAGRQKFEPAEFDEQLGKFWKPPRRFFVL